LLAAPGITPRFWQAVKEALEVTAGDDCSLPEFACGELAAANGAVNRVAAQAGPSADFIDRICEPALAAGDLRFAFHEEASFRLPTQSDGRRMRKDCS
jgi:hypothetical protein